MEMDTTMTIEEFEERALAYGARMESWPPGDRVAARSLLAGSERARAILEEARSLDAMLDLWEGPQPSHALLSRVLADAAAVTQESRPVEAAAAPTREGWFARLFGGMSLLRPGLALAACLALGVAMGTSLEESVLPVAAPDPVEAIAAVEFAFALEDDADLLLGPEALL